MNGSNIMNMLIGGIVNELMWFLILSIQPKIRLTITCGVCISISAVVELAGGGSATNRDTSFSLYTTATNNN